MHHRWVLLLLVRSVNSCRVGFERPVKPTYAAHSWHAKRCERVVDVHVVFPVLEEEVIEWAAATEELSEDCVRVPVEAVVAALTSMSSASSVS